MKSIRMLAAASASVLLLLGACTSGDDDDVTPSPSELPPVEVVADFQLVGEIDEAFAGTEPDVDVPDEEEQASPQPDDEEVTGPTIAPEETPVGGTPSVGGVMRITVEDVSEDLTAECGIAADEDVEVFWTTETGFDPEDVLDDIEDEIEGRVAGVSGRILRSGSDEDGTIGAADTPRPPVSVDDTPSADETGSPGIVDSPDLRSDTGDTGDCLLVADQVGFTTPSLPTPAPVVRRPAAPTPVRTSEPTATPEPDEDEKTPKPEKTPEATATATVEQSP